jgi:hypothetical protein
MPAGSPGIIQAAIDSRSILFLVAALFVSSYPNRGKGVRDKQFSFVTDPLGRTSSIDQGVAVSIYPAILSIACRLCDDWPNSEAIALAHRD